MHPNLPSGFNPLLTLAARETKIAALAAKVEIMPKLIFAMAFAIVPGVIAVPDTAHAACKVEGVWEQVSLTWDGRVMPPHSRPLRKIVFRGHWIEIGGGPFRNSPLKPQWHEWVESGPRRPSIHRG